MKWITESMKRSRKLKDQYSMRGTEIYINEQPPEHIDLEFVFEGCPNALIKLEPP